MDQLSELRAFCRVAEAGGFSTTAAAATFNGSRMVVPSKYRRHGLANTGVALRLAASGGIGIAVTASFFAKVRAFVEFAAEIYRRPAWS